MLVALDVVNNIPGVQVGASTIERGITRLVRSTHLCGDVQSGLVLWLQGCVR